MDVKFISTTSDRLPELPIVNGQLVYLSDKNASYYDIAGSRLFISGVRLVTSLPATGQENVLYVIISQSGYVNSYIWDSTITDYRPISGEVATVDQLGLVKPDGTTITIASDGTISSHAPVDTLPATSITYDNMTSQLAATNVQLAIDEVSQNANDASASASTAILLATDAADTAAAATTAAQSAMDAATDATTAAASATSIATDAASQAAAATTAVIVLQDLLAAATTAIVDLQTRLAAVEGVAEVALITEDPS